MRFSPTKLLHGLLYMTPVLLLTLAACGGGGSGPTTTLVAPSTAPTVSTPVAGCNAINLNWTAVTSATGYNVYGAASGVPVALLTATPVTTTSYTDAGLLGNTTYNYQVMAVNSAGNGPTSTVASATTALSCNFIGGSIQGNSLNLTGEVITLAGAGTLAPGFTNGTGTSAQFNTPNGITTDGTNLYVADTLNNAIRKIVIATGVVSTVAGSGAAGSDNGSGAAATFNLPKGITTDGTNLYVADKDNGSIRKIDNNGLVSTLASGFNFPAGITYDGADLYVADTGNNTIKKVTTLGVVSAFASGLDSPQGITYDGANFYVANTGNSTIQKVTTGGTVSTFASGLLFPQGITTDGMNLYVADTSNNVIRKIVISSPTLTTLAGAGTQGSADGTGTAATFRLPGSITTDGTNLYAVDTGNHAIRKIQ